MRHFGRTAFGLSLFLTLAVPMPSHAVDLRVSPPPAVGLPSRDAFQELVLHFAQPNVVGAEGFTAPPLSLAVRSRAVGFIAPHQTLPNTIWDALGAQALDMPLIDLPAGNELHAFFRQNNHREFRLRDLGPLLRGENGPLQRTIRRVLGEGVVADWVGKALLAGAMMGAVQQLGSQRAFQVGLAPSATGTSADGRWEGWSTVFSEPGFVNLRTDVGGRMRLPSVLPLALGSPREDFIEAGLTYVNTGDFSQRLATRWAKLRTRTPTFEIGAGIRSNQGESSCWAESDVAIRRQRWVLQTTLRHQVGTPHIQAVSAMTVQRRDALFGVFLSLSDTLPQSLGMIVMANF